MVPIDRAHLRAVEVALAVAVLLVVAVIATGSPAWYPSWPTLAGFPVDPELVLPGLLGLVALLGAVLDGFGVVPVVVAVLGSTTALFAAASIQTLLTATGGGVFAGGLFTLAVGTPLAVAVLLRELARRGAFDRVEELVVGT